MRLTHNSLRPRCGRHGPEPVSAAEDPAVDPVTKQATQLESQLSKVRSTTGEAGEVMLKLVDIYHQNGRVFGLIRVSQSFVTLFPAHPSHKDVMLKLMDGLQVTGRNKEVIATGRQFLVRYPKDPGCAGVEGLLAQLLARNGETAAAASVNESHWAPARPDARRRTHAGHDGRRPVRGPQ